VIFADLSSYGSVAWGLQRGKVGSLLWSLARRCGSSRFAPIRPHVDLLCWLSLPRPTKERPYELLGPWAFREAFYFFSGPRGYLSPTVTASTSSSAPKPKRAKVSTCRLKFFGTTDVLKLIGSAEVAPLATETAPAMPIEASAGPVKEPESEKAVEQPKVLSPPAVIGLSKPSSTTTATPRKRRMATVLDVLESMKAPVFASVEASREKSEDARETITATTTTALAEAEPLKVVPIGLVEESVPEKSKSPAPKAPPHGDLEYIVRHASGKQSSLEQIVKVEHYAKDLKYPRGSLIYGGDDEDDFLYCLPDSKEVNVCREMMNNMGFPKLELGLSAMTKDQLADSLAYNSLKVCIFWLRIWYFSRYFFGNSYFYCLFALLFGRV
jgi:hypothetical protein